VDCRPANFDCARVRWPEPVEGAGLWDLLPPNERNVALQDPFLQIPLHPRVIELLGLDEVMQGIPRRAG
jgi:hypothetical protein